MKKLLNVRLPVIFAFALAAGTALGFIFIYYSIDLRFIIAAIPVFAAVFIVCALILKRKTPLIAIAVVGLIFTAGAVNCFLRIDNYSDSPLTSGQTYEITATVYEKGKSARGEYVMLKNLRADGRKINGKMRAYLSEIYGDFCDVGYGVSFSAEIERYDPFPYGKLNYFAEENVKYGCTVYGSLTAKRGFSPLASIRAAIRGTLYSTLDSDTASIAYALLTGNTYEVDSDSMENFRYGGIAHVFAISGLHIGIVFWAISFLTKKMRMNKYAAAAVCLALIFFYAALCGFTPSSVRAAIMCAVAAAGKLFYRKYDSLNALSVAAAIILLITPLSLFAAGFQLSVCAVGGIVLLSKSLSARFENLPSKISSAAGASLAAQAGTLPVMLAKFGYLSGAGLLLNIFVVPLISIIFVMLLICTALSCLFGFAAHIIMPIAALPLKFLISALMTESFEGALLGGFGAGAFIPLYYLGLFALSDKINLKALQRITAFVCAAVMLVTYVSVKAFPPNGIYKIYVGANHGGGSVLIKHGKQNILIITQGLSASGIKTMLNEKYSADIDAVIILGGEDSATAFGAFGLDCEKLFCFSGNIQLQPYKDATVFYESEFTLGGTQFSFYDGYSLLAQCGGIKIGISAGETSFTDCDITLAQNSTGETAKFNAYYEDRSAPYSLYDCGALEFNVKDGNITLTTPIPDRPYFI